MTEYWTDFVQESSDRITELNNALLTLERSPDDTDAMEEVFRIAHTLKGNCGAAGLESASELAHAIEDLLDAVRSGRLQVSPELMDDIFDAVDELETMIENVDETGSVDTDPSASIRALRGHLEGPAPIEPPSDDEIEDVLSRFEPPAGDQNAYFVRISVDESVVEGGNAGILVVEALIDAFDLIGTAPPRQSIEADAYNGRFDAVFASAVTKAAIESGLEPVDEVAAFELVDVTDTFETVAARADADDGSESEISGPDDIDISPDEAQELEVDELLGEFDQYDDLDELVEEVEDDEDLDAFDDMGKAGSFDDLLDDDDVDVEFDEEDIGDPDAVSDDGREADAAGTATAPDPTAETATDAGESEPSSSTADETGSPQTEPAAGSEPADDEPVDDAEAVFQELKDEVEMVGFDELQEELEELEFDEFDTDDEVGMDELLGDEVDDDGDDPFLAEESSEDVLDDEFDDLDDVDEVSDDELADAISPADDATDDVSVAETDDETESGSIAESDEIGDSDADRESMGDTADAVTDAVVADAVDGEETTAPESNDEAASSPVVDDGDDAIDSGAATDTEIETAVGGVEEDEVEVKADEADEDESSSAGTPAGDADAVDTRTAETETADAEAAPEIDGPTDSTDAEIDGTDVESDDHSSDSSDADPAANSDAEAPSDSADDDFGTETGGFEPATDNLETDDDAESAASRPAADTAETSDSDRTEEAVDFSQFGSEIGASGDAESAATDADATDTDDSEFRSDDDAAPSTPALESRDADADEEADGDSDADVAADTGREVPDTDTEPDTAGDTDLEPVTDTTDTDTATDPADGTESVHASDSPATADSTGQSDPAAEAGDGADEFEAGDDAEFDSVPAAGEDESGTDLETPDSSDVQASDEGAAAVETSDAEPAVDDDDGDDVAFDDDSADAAFGDDTLGDDALDDSALEDDSFDDLETEPELDDSVGFDEPDDSFDDAVGDDAFSDPGAGADDFEDVGVDAAADFETEPGPSDSFDDTTAPADDGFDAAETTDTDDGFGAESDDADETSDRIVDEPNLEIPDITLPDDGIDRDADDDDDEMQSVRVDVEQIDDLLTLVEGLVTSRVRLRHAVESGEDRQALETELDALEDLTTDLQDTVMEVRLVPLETVTNRLPRVVRDISRDQGKEVAFEMRGEDVELDRTILDRISDPLIHLVRNAVDHGIEPPERREEADKPREGTVEVTATRSRDRVTITVEDDGDGIDPDRLRSEAVEEGVISEDDAAGMTDDQVYDLVFHPGLSTADEVTDVSGRGVGMDVVKRTVTELDGSVSIDSTPGDGTTITMTLPVSIAIDDILFVESGDREFGLPTEVVQDVESARAIEMVDGEPVLPTDDDTDDIPVVHLGDELETAAAGTGGEADDVVVRIREDVRRVALRCDQVNGQQEVVVKPFDGFMNGIPGLSGATVRGRGKVVNIIDVTTL